MKIFLSHASEDATIAEQIQLALVGDGHHVFFDKASLPPGSDYHSRIREAIGQSEAMIFLISPHAVEKDRYTLTEAKLAREKWGHPKGYVLPVMLATTDRKQIPPFLDAATYLIPEGNIAAEVVAHMAMHPLGGSLADIPHNLSFVGRGLKEDLQDLDTADEPRRRKIVDYFEKIADCLREVHDKLGRGEIPHGACERVNHYGDLLPEVVAGFLGSDRAADYASLLKSAHNARMLIANPEGQESQLPEIDKAANTFRALADSVQAGLGR